MAKYSWPERQPKWREGIYYPVVEPGSGGNPPRVYLKRYRPTVGTLCEQLLTPRKYRVGTTTIYPYVPFSRRIEIFTDALDMIEMFSSYRELRPLCQYRRHVTMFAYVREIDVRLLSLVRLGINAEALKSHDLLYMAGCVVLTSPLGKELAYLAHIQKKEEEEFVVSERGGRQAAE